MELISNYCTEGVDTAEAVVPVYPSGGPTTLVDRAFLLSSFTLLLLSLPSPIIPVTLSFLCLFFLISRML
jgi:hypothetical protein